MTAYAAWVLRPSVPDGDVAASTSCLICCTQRTGGWLLCGLLDSSGVAGRPHEWFSPETERSNRERWGIDSPDAYVEAVLRAGTTPNGVFAAKVTWSDVERLEGALRALPKPSFVWLRRRDTIAQAVSWALAGQTGVYHAWDQGGEGEPTFDWEEIDAFVRLIRDQEQAWSSWFRERGIDPLLVRYEELVEDPQREGLRLLTALQTIGKLSLAVQTERLANGVAEEWADRYREGRKE